MEDWWYSAPILLAEAWHDEVSLGDRNVSVQDCCTCLFDRIRACVSSPLTRQTRTFPLRSRGTKSTQGLCVCVQVPLCFQRRGVRFTLFDENNLYGSWSSKAVEAAASSAASAFSSLNVLLTWLGEDVCHSHRLGAAHSHLHSRLDELGSRSYPPHSRGALARLPALPTTICRECAGRGDGRRVNNDAFSCSPKVMQSGSWEPKCHLEGPKWLGDT